MQGMYTELNLRNRYSKLLPLLDERTVRLVLASDAALIGRGGIVLVANSSGVSRSTINVGLKQLESATKPSVEGKGRNIRKAGGGRKKATEKDKELLSAIDELVTPHTMGNPMNPL